MVFYDIKGNRKCRQLPTDALIKSISYLTNNKDHQFFKGLEYTEICSFKLTCKHLTCVLTFQFFKTSKFIEDR